MDTSPACPGQENHPTLTSLPVEIQEIILSQLDSFRTLEYIAVTCRTFKDLVLYHPQGIIDRILESVIPDEVFPEAITFFEASRLPTTNAEIVQELLGRYFTSLKGNMGPRPRFSLSEATALEKYHQLIQRFTQIFISTALSKHPITGDEVKPPWLVTKREQYRIQRALYRFELYWKLFKRLEKKDRSQRHPQLAITLQHHSKLYFDHFAPWENEQIICIQDFLLRIVDEGESWKQLAIIIICFFSGLLYIQRLTMLLHTMWSGVNGGLNIMKDTKLCRSTGSDATMYVSVSNTNLLSG